jgi:hypothetical protein
MKVKQSSNFHHFCISKTYKHRDELKRDGDSFIEKIKLTNLGCPHSFLWLKEFLCKDLKCDE